MAVDTSVHEPELRGELDQFLEQLRGETILLALVGVGVLGVAILGPIAVFGDPAEALVLGLVLLLLGLAVWALRAWSYLAAAVLLVCGVLVSVLLASAWTGVGEAVFLLIVPVGLATLTISRAAGVVSATCCALLLALAPPSLVPGDPRLRIVAIIAVWSIL